MLKKKNSILSELFEIFRQNKCPGKVFNPTLLQESLDFNFKYGYFEVATPEENIQAFKRVNRWGNLGSDCQITLFMEINMNIFNSGAKGYKETVLAWREHLKNFNEKSLNDEELMEEIYDGFWKNKNNQNEFKKILEYRIKEANDYLGDWFPRRKSNKKKGGRLINSKGFRGLSLVMSACKIDEKGNPAGQLKKEELLSEGCGFKTSDFKGTFQFLFKKLKKEDLNCEESFEYDKYTPDWLVGKTETTPLFYSHEKALEIPEEDSKTWGVYHEELGLMGLNIYKKLFKKA